MTQISRRGLLQGLAASAAVPLVPGAATPTDAAFDPARKPQRAVFQQQVYFNFDGNGETYNSPVNYLPVKKPPTQEQQ